MKRVFAMLVVLAVLAGLVYAGRRFWPLLAEREKGPPVYQGYVEGEFVQVSAPVAGRLDVMRVARGDRIRVGEPLFELESEYERAALRAAEAERATTAALLADMQTGKRPPEVAAIQAQLDQAVAVEKDSAVQLERDRALYLRGGIPKSQLDKSQAEEDANLARIRELQDNIAVARLPSRDMQIAAQVAAVEATEAKVGQAEWTLGHKKIASTREGLVYDVVYRLGEWVPAGQPVVRMLPPENVKIRFYIPEAALASLRVGQGVKVGRDGAATVSATITYISAEAEFTSPVIYSNESRYKLTFMVEAHASPEVSRTLNPGQPVYVEIG